MARPVTPAAPAIYSITARTAVASWAHPTGSDPAILDYHLQLSTRSNFSTIASSVTSITGGPAGVTYNMVAFQPGTTYYVRVRARNADGYGDFSGGASFTTLPEVPGAPRNLKQDMSSGAYSSSMVRATWAAPSNDGGGAITGYDLQASTSSGFGSIAASWSGNSLAAQLTGLSYARGYHVRVRAKNAAGPGPWLTVGQSSGTWVFATSYNPPAAPSGVSTTLVNAQYAHVNWVPTTETSAPTNYTDVEQQNYEGANSGVWASVASPSSGFYGLTVGDGQALKWRLRAVNSYQGRIQRSAWVETSPLYTYPHRPGSPQAPRKPSVERLPDGNLKVWIASTNPYPVDSHEYEDRPGGGTPVTVGFGYRETEYAFTHVSPNPTVTHQYRARSVKGDLKSNWTDWSDVVSLAAPPLAPTDLRAEGASSLGSDVVAGESVTLRWQHNVGSDLGPQSAAQIRWRLAAAPSWNTITTGSSTALTFSVPNAEGQDLLWGVRTRGTVSAGYGDWSDTSTLTIRARPDSPTIIEPVSTVTSIPFEVSWDHGFPASAASRIRIDIAQAGRVLDTQFISPELGAEASTTELTTALVGGETYQILLASTSDGIFWSSSAEVTVLAVFPAPPAPEVSGYWDYEAASVTLTVANPPPVGAEVDATHNRIQRSLDGTNWATLATIMAGDTYTDPVPPLSADLQYRALAVSGVPSTAVGEPVALPWRHSRCRIYVNAGSDFDQVATASRSSTSISHGHEARLVHFEGRAKPVALFGQASALSESFSGFLSPHTSSPKEWAELASKAQIFCYRTCEGRRIFGVISKIQLRRIGPLTLLEFAVTEAGYEEGSDALQI